MEEAALPRDGRAVCGAIPRLTLLLVDDDATSRAILRAMLEQDGHRVLEAGDGAAAVEVFQAERPDMVLMDVMMPEMDGYQATTLIKSLSAGRFVPVIFLTSVLDDESLALCVACGGDDFLPKPYNHMLLRAKLKAMDRMRQLYNEVAAQRDELLQHHRRLQTEHEVAERVFSKILHANPLTLDNLRVHFAPMAITNGDVVFAAPRPTGDGRHLMLGDFTGHGLSAALGAMPVSDIFYAMTARGFSLQSIVLEINKKLREKLPTGLFMAAAFIHHNSRKGHLEVINCGLPEVLVIGRDGRLKARAASRNLPLGVVGGETFQLSVETLAVAPGDRVLVYSDGLIEAVNEAGELFGEQRLMAVLEQGHPAHRLYERIREAVDRFRGRADQSDDITLVEMVCLAAPRLEAARGRSDETGEALVSPGGAETAWRLHLELGPAALREFDLNLFLSQAMGALPALRPHATTLFTILAELYSNALEHGLLKLDSTLKGDADGFARYYQEREQRLGALEQGWIRVELGLLHGEGGPQVVLAVEDSSDGFDFQRAGEAAEDNAEGGQACGRGLHLLRSLCRELRYSKNGARVEAYWRP